jgi:hypothetical protein
MINGLGHTKIGVIFNKVQRFNGATAQRQCKFLFFTIAPLRLGALAPFYYI